MSNAALDPDEHSPDAAMEPVFDELEGDHALLSYIEARVVRIVAASTLKEAHERAEALQSYVAGRRNAIRGEMMRLRMPDA